MTKDRARGEPETQNARGCSNHGRILLISEIRRTVNDQHRFVSRPPRYPNVARPPLAPAMVVQCQRVVPMRQIGQPAALSYEIPIDEKSPRALNLKTNEKKALPREKTMRALRLLALAMLLAIPVSAAAQEPISNLPRNQTLIVENPEGTS